MIPELGHFALMLSLVICLVQGVLPLAGTFLKIRSWVDLARPAAVANALFLTIAFGILAWCFLTSDFTVLNVANNSNSLLPWYYKLAATWGSHEGSILFWVVCLSWWTCAVAFSARSIPEITQARVISVLGLVSVGFLLFILMTSDPFARLFPPAPEGADLNPLLQDPGMVFHPPLLYLGYVGFSVPFAFAIAALLGGRLDIAWSRWMRPWTTAAWVLLTLGIALGSFWSYYELGWGGWWAWDPVENSSFLPWLTGTALFHSLAVTEKRGCFKIWTVFLAILTFSLSLLGTFGIDVKHNEYRQFFIEGRQRYAPARYNVEGDWSGASCLLVAGATTGEVTVRNLNPVSLQADMAIVDALTRAGAQITTTTDSVTVRRSPLHAFEFDATHCPDLFPALAALAAAADGVSTIRGTSRLLHKESNRAEAIREEYAKTGIEVDISEEDVMRIRGGKIRPARVSSHDDHRMAMSMAVSALRCDGQITIENAECVAKSYPGFFEDLEKIRV